MSKLDTLERFWDSEQGEKLDTNATLLYFYLLTSPYDNGVGVYPITEKKIAYHTGLSKDSLKKALNSLSEQHLVYYEQGCVIVKGSMIEHEKLNTNRTKNRVAAFRKLPPMLLENILGDGYFSFVRHKSADKITYKMLHEAVESYAGKAVPKKEKPKKEEFAYRALLETLIIKFDKSYRPNTEAAYKAWHETLRKLIEIDKYTEDQIVQAVLAGKNNPLYGPHFHSLTRLRERKGKDVGNPHYIAIYLGLNKTSIAEPESHLDSSAASNQDY